jgi:hypothetical protein
MKQGYEKYVPGTPGAGGGLEVFGQEGEWKGRGGSGRAQ